MAEIITQTRLLNQSDGSLMLWVGGRVGGVPFGAILICLQQQSTE